MKWLLTLLAVLTFTEAIFAAAPSVGSPSPKQPLYHQIYLAYNGTGNGTNKNSPLPLSSGDVWNIPAGAVLTKVYAIVDSAMTGLSSGGNIGDADSATTWVTGSSSITPISTVTGMKANTSSPQSPKYYSAAGLLKWAATGTASAGKMRIVVEGYYVGTNP